MKNYVIAFLASALLTVISGIIALPLLKKLKAGQFILKYVKEHESKNGTPTMGGLFFVISSVVVTLALSRFANRQVNVICAVGIAYMAVGFLDDFLKIKLKHNEGLKAYQKIIFQLAIAIITSIFAYKEQIVDINIPFVNQKLNIGAFCLPLYVLAFLATTNCVNLTDGLDGLASGVSGTYLVLIASIIILQNGGVFTGVGLSAVSLSGALFGFLIFNTNKAKVFMGDTGSLSVGGFISAISIFSGNTLYIPVLGIIFVLSGISVIMQVLHFKRTGNRIFLMAPYHHHLQMKGKTEAEIAFLYKFITVIIGLACILFLL